MCQDMKSRSRDGVGELNVANSIAVRQNARVLPTFINNLTYYFNTPVMIEDFSSHKAVDHINQWVSEQTHDKIPQLFSSLKPDTVMVLLNAIYFKGQWQVKFHKSRTAKARFQLGPDHFTDVDTMYVEGHFKYAEFDDGQLVEIPYKTGNLSMYLFVPTGFHQHGVSTLLKSMPFEQRLQSLEFLWVKIE